MKTIFIIDDSDTNLMAAKTALYGAYKTFALPSAAKMFKLLEKITPDLILLDIYMPEMDGFQAIEILKAKPETKDIPVIFLSSFDDEAHRSKGLALGAVDYITKPYDKALLLERLERITKSKNA